MQSSAKAPAIGRFLERQDPLSCGQKWLACLTPFFKESETQKLRLSASGFFFSQVEYCDNLIFQRRARSHSAGLGLK
jgi:hypothetical protein